MVRMSSGARGNIRGAGIFIAQVSNFPRPRIRHDILAFAHPPGKGNLRKGRVIARWPPAAGAQSSSWFLRMVSGSGRRGRWRRKSSADKTPGSVVVPVQEAAAKRGCMAQSRPPARGRCGGIPASGSRLHSEYSVCTAAIGCTLQARRSVTSRSSDRPIWRILPSLTRSAIVPTTSSTGYRGIDAVLIETDRWSRHSVASATLPLIREYVPDGCQRRPSAPRPWPVGKITKSKFGGNLHLIAKTFNRFFPTRTSLSKGPYTSAVSGKVHAHVHGGMDRIYRPATFQRRHRQNSSPYHPRPNAENLKLLFSKITCFSSYFP